MGVSLGGDEQADLVREDAGEAYVAERAGDLHGDEDGEDLQGEDGEEEGEEEAPGGGRVLPRGHYFKFLMGMYP